MNSAEMLHPFSATDLVVRVQQGDRLAEQQLVEQYQSGLLLILRRQTKADIAQEVAQETWRIVIEKIRLAELREPEKLGAFIAQIGRNQLIMHYRRERNAGADSDQIPEVEHTQGPVELLEQADAQRIARQLLGQLGKERDREILQRYYLDEEEKDSICEDMELTDLHFNRVIHRAKQRLRLLAESLGITF